MTPTMTLADQHDTPDQIAFTLRELADEVMGNETRPSATDIADRVQQAANRVVNLQNEFDLAVKTALATERPKRLPPNHIDYGSGVE